MSMNSTLKALAAPALAVVMMMTLTPLLAQESVRIAFERGNDTGAASGVITGSEYRDYLLRAKADQRMSVALSVESSDGNGSAYFNILPPGSDNVAIFNSASSANNYGEVRLPQTGDYRIRVYLMGNDADTGKSVGYTLSVTFM
jgi:hypothetical protein